MERFVCRRRSSDLDVPDTALGNTEDFFIHLDGPDLAPQHRVDHPGLRGMAPVALCLAQAGHQLQIQPAMAEGVCGLPVQKPDLRQHVLHPGERRADMDRLRTAAAVGLRQPHRADDQLCGTPGGLHRAIFSGALYPRGGILLRAPPAALAAALCGVAQTAPSQYQSRAVVRPFHAPH